MVELQPCTNLIEAPSAFRTVNEELKLKDRNLNIAISKISAELQRERQRNTELMERISVLESQLQQRDKESLLSKCIQGSCLGDYSGKRKRHESNEITENEQIDKSELAIAMIPKEEFREQKTHVSDSVKNGNVVDDSKETGNGDNEDIDIAQKEENLHDKGVGVIPFQKGSCLKKPYKVAFCPREVKRIIESEVLQQKNAQSHTMRKIIAFASFGSRHGFEDLYELDFNHFTLLRKGEPFVSPDNPGEHVRYENPGSRGKILYPNRENPTLCPVQILEEEKAMRPSDSSCPSCLFLCIKYGGSTRNLPQNEYVRQRMGRNKLKSFGPLMCRMALLVNVRSGSFFFKALGITLMYMAGFPDDIVQRDTKYRSLDLLQKYYRTDEDAEGEQLFLEHFRPEATASNHYDKPPSKRTPILKSKTNQPRTNDKNPRAQESSAKDSPSTSRALPKFGLIGNRTNYHTEAAMFPSTQSQSQKPENPMWFSSAWPTNYFIPMMFWPNPNSYSRFPSAATYFHTISAPLPHCYYGYAPIPAPTPNSFPGGTTRADVTNAAAFTEAGGRSGSSSSSS